MKAYLKILVTFSFLLIVGKLYSQEIEVLHFAEKFKKENFTQVVQSILPKTERLKSSQRGSVEMMMDANVPDSVRICANVAAELWQSVLNNKYPIRIDVCYQNLESDNDIQIDVSYYYNNSNTIYPTSLYSYLFNVDMSGKNQTADAIIYINKNTKWDCSYNEKVCESSCNITFAMMRAIATVLGFGSSVTQKTIRGNDIIAFGNKNGYSVFDNLIFSSQGKFLNEIANIGNRENPELTSYVQPVQGTFLYVLKQDDKHKLYAPESFENYNSLVYLNNKESLMHFDLKTGMKKFRVDATTVELLNTIGWNLKKSEDVKIVGNDIDETGLASAYEDHTFTVKNDNGGIITDAVWSYMLPLQNGKDTLVSQRLNSLSFSIKAIDNESKYRINMNGDISGKIIFSGKINGKDVEDVFNISLELKPKIKAVKIIKKESNYPLSSYNIYYTVEYVGSDHLFIQVEEEFAGGMESQIIYEPFFAHVESKYLTAPFYNWVDIKVENKYGEEIYTIELPPYTDGDVREIPNNRVEFKSPYTIIEVLNEHGMTLNWVTSLNDLRINKKGLYILKFYKGNICVKTTKYLKL